MSVKVDIHADDYGYSLNTSEDILDCMKEGKLDSFSVICNTKWFDESMELLYKTIPSLPFLPLISIHLNLPEGKQVSDLLPMSWGKLFLSSYGFKRKQIKEAIKSELKTQIDVSQKAIDKCILIAKEHGVACKQKSIRLDSHVHTHLIPVVWTALTELIQEENYDVEYIRNPKEPLMPFLRKTSLWPTYSLVNFVKNRILMFYSGKVDKYCEQHGLDKIFMWGLVMSGHMDYDRIQNIYPDMLKTAEKNNRTLEILFHPGKAELSEKSAEMNDGYFSDFNSSENRHIEKNAVMEIKKITG